MIRSCNIFGVDGGIHTKNGGKTSLRFWSGYLHQPKKYYNDSLSHLMIIVINSIYIPVPRYTTVKGDARLPPRSHTFDTISGKMKF